MHFRALCNLPGMFKAKPGQLTKTLLIMKFTAIILLAACMNVSAKSYAQLITITAKNTPLEQVLKKIKDQSGYHMVYREEWMAAANNVTISLKQVSLQEALNECFPEPAI